MREAPPLAVRFRRLAGVRFAVALLAAMAGMSAMSLLPHGLEVPPGVLTALMLAVALVSAGSALLALGPGRWVDLRSDPSGWRLCCGASASDIPVLLQVSIDLGAWVLLRVHAASDRRTDVRWLAVSLRDMGEQQLAFRTALYCAPMGSADRPGGLRSLRA